MSREALARASRGENALSVPTIKRAESGQAIHLSSARSLATVLGVSLDDLAHGVTSEDGLSVVGRQASVAVLPFETPEPANDCRIVADGLVDDLTSRLATYWFPVIARSSSFSLQGERLEPREIGDRLGADYLVEGSVRRGSGRIRTNARLVETSSALQIWGDTYESAATEVFEVQDYFCFRILSQIGNQVLSREAERARKRKNVELDAWQNAMMGAWHHYRSTPQDNREARTYLHRALAIDETLGFARYLLVLSHQHDLLNQWTDDVEATRREMRVQTQQFDRLVPDSAWAHVAAGYTSIAHGERSEAVDRLQRALDLDGNSVAAHSLYGQALAMSSLPDQGLHELRLARELSPRDAGMWAILLTTGLAHFAAGNYEECVPWVKRAVASRSQVPMCYAALASAYAHLGEPLLARQALAQMVRRDGAMRLGGFQAILGITDKEISERFLAGLKLAGLPEK